MAIAASNLTSGNATTALQTSATTASVSPASNNLELLTVVNETLISVDPNEPTITGNGLTWVKVGTTVFDNGGVDRKRITVFRAMGSSPSSGAITIDFAGQVQAWIQWALDEFSGIDTSGTNGSGAIVQSAVNQDTGAVSSLTVTLGAFSSASNATYGAFAASGYAFTEGSGFTRLYRYPDSTGSDDLSSITEWKSTNDTSVDASIGGDTSEMGGIAAEIKIARLIKTIDGLAIASVKTDDGLAIASVKTVDDLA